MTMFIVVSVPESDAADLDDVSPAFEVTPERVSAHPFDGEALTQVVGALSTGGLGALTVWIRARAAERKHFRISVDGLELTGYEPEEAERIIKALQDRSDSSSADS